MPVSEILAQMQYDGVFVDQKEIVKYGEGMVDKLVSAFATIKKVTYIKNLLI